MRKRFKGSEIERDFQALFGNKAHWTWPFIERDLVGSIFNLGLTTFFVSLGLRFFIHLDWDREKYLALAAVVFLWETVRLNFEFLRDFSLRRRLQQKYMPLVEHTEAFQLLEDALDGSKKGIVQGLSTKEESDEMLMKLWKACFIEADHLSARQQSMGFGGDLIDQRPMSDQIKGYFDERQQAFQELNS